MKTKAAVLHGVHQEWQVEEIEIDPPKANEVLVEWKVAGLCHSDEHVVTGDMGVSDEQLAMAGADHFYPIVGGHEGAGVVVEVGPGVTLVQPGDHVSASFVPSCGRCRYCVSGRQNLCDYGAGTLVGGMITDGTPRHFTADKTSITMFAKLGTFSNHACVAENSLIKVDDDLPFDVVALVSCGVATGWGSATNRADVRPGETVVVVGIGGIGINAVQGAAMARARRVIAIDPIEFKREKAMEFGATHTFASMADAMPAVNDLTWGQMADKVIMTPGVMYGELMDLGTKLAGKGGTIVVTAVAPMTQTESSINLFELAMWNKEIKGTIFGSLNPRIDIPRLLGLYRDGQLKLDELITQRYPLTGINDGYEAMRQGENIRGIIVMTEARQLLQRVLGRVVGREREIELVVAALAADRHVLLEGPPGTGKSTLLRAVADELGLGFEFVEGNAELTPARLVGHFDPARVLTDGYDPDVFVDGPLVTAMRDGSLLYVEEINRIPEETLNVLITVMSERELHVPRFGWVPAADGFRLVAAMNPFDAIGTARISSAVYDRVRRLAVGYQSADDEAAIVVVAGVARSPRPAADDDGLDPAWLAKVVDVVRRTREHPEVRIGSSVRGAIDTVAVARSSGGLRAVPPTDRGVCLDAAIVALAGRLRLREGGTPRKPEDIVTEIWLEVFGSEADGEGDGQGKATAPAGAAPTR